MPGPSNSIVRPLQRNSIGPYGSPYIPALAWSGYTCCPRTATQLTAATAGST